MSRIIILDGYTDEPAGLGVPPYLDIYARYISGAIWCVDSSIDIKYITIDEVRRDWQLFGRLCRKAEVLIVIAGVTTPGKYLNAEPIRLNELEIIAKLFQGLKILVGPVARFGYGESGGQIAIPSKYFENLYDIVVKGDPDLVIYELTRNNFQLSKVDVHAGHENYDLINVFAIKGARIVTQHPCYDKNLIVEIETYRSCPRWICGGCSFCITVRYGSVTYRNVDGIVKEAEALYNYGVKHFRLGRQADFYTYMAKDTGKLEFPKPTPEIIEKLLRGIRYSCPDLETLHIDNVNPGTIYHWPNESKEITKILMKYHTPGNVAAMGVETADPKVVKMNNLKVMPEEAFFAVKLISEIGRVRGWNGMPHILPGINFVLGLPGETKETYILNMEFLRKLLEEDVWIRRVNIRQVLTLPTTPLWHVRERVRSILQNHKRYIDDFRKWVREYFDHEMLKRVFPKGTVLRKLFTEIYEASGTLARQVGSYPLIVYIPEKLSLHKWIDVVIVDHISRSVVGIPYPLNVNTASSRLLKYLPGISKKEVYEIIKRRPFKNMTELEKIITSKDKLKYLTIE